VSFTRAVWRGALAGAAGTTALNAVTYADMTVRGRPESKLPAEMVETAAEAADVEVPGSDEARGHRTSALGALSGIATGVVVGAAYGALRGLGLRVPPALAGIVLGGAAMGLTMAPAAALDVSDPRGWSASDWISDVVPHLAYGWATAATFDAGR
jgi:hypothetical protein